MHVALADAARHLGDAISAAAALGMRPLEALCRRDLAAHVLAADDLLPT